MQSSPRAVLLDAMGTLLRLEPPAPRLREELRHRLGAEVSETAALDAMAAEIAFYRAHLDEGRDPDALAGLRARCAEVVRDALAAVPEVARAPGVELTAALLAAIRFAPFPDATPALGALRDAGVRLVVVSNWDISLSGVLAEQGLAALLDGVVTSAEVGARKPAPAIFRRGLELAGVPAGAALHVGDSVAEDIAGARAAGVRAVLICRDGAPAPEGVRTIASLRELVAPGR